MSFEGFYQQWCSQGHYWETDGSFICPPPAEDFLCPDCGQEPTFSNLVDDTNCDMYGWIKPEINTEAVVKTETCNLGHEHRTLISAETYKIPESKEPQTQPTEAVMSHNLEIVGKAKGEIVAKRMGLPGLVLRSKCPECGEVVSLDMNRDPNRLSYPLFGEPTRLNFYHFNEETDHEGEWSVLVQWDLSIRSLDDDQKEMP